MVSHYSNHLLILLQPLTLKPATNKSNMSSVQITKTRENPITEYQKSPT